MGATPKTKMEATHNDQPNNEILCEASTGIETIDAVPTVRRHSDTERQRTSMLPLHTRRIMGGDCMKCRKPLKHRPAMEGVLHCKQCATEALHESMPDKNWDDGDDGEQCAICADDYHDSDQYICDDCHNELEALQADQEASRWD